MADAREVYGQKDVIVLCIRGCGEGI